MTVRGLVAYEMSRQMVTEDMELERCLGCSERCVRRAVTPASGCGVLCLVRQDQHAFLTMALLTFLNYVVWQRSITVDVSVSQSIQK